MKHTRRRLARIWYRSWILTLPVALVFGLWAVNTHARWSAFAVRHSTSQDFSLHAVGALEKDHIVRTAKLAATEWRTGEKLAASGLDTVHLFIQDGSRQRLDASLPHSGFEYVEGGLLNGGEVQEVDLRYRGDNVYHWGYWKKSWRVKTKRDALYKGMRKFNLVAPRSREVLNNHLAHRLAAHMGLIAPYSEVVNVAVNGEFLGVYVLTEQIEETTIRRHGRMPGDVYSGELVGRDIHVGLEGRLFDHPGVWTKAAVNNHFPEDALDPLEALLRAIAEAQGEDGHRRLSDLVDMDAFGRYSAFETLVCTVHVDALHNWRLYYDPWRTGFEPIVWDPFGWHWTMVWGPRALGQLPDVITSPFHAALFQNADFLRARSAAFRDFFEQGTDEAFLAEARDLVERIGPALELDPHLVADVEMLRPQEVEEEMQRLVRTIEGVFREVRRIHVDDPGASARFQRVAPGHIALEVGGRRPVAEVDLTFSAPVRGALSARLRWGSAHGPQERDVTGRSSVSGSRVRVRCDLIGGHDVAIASMEPTSAHRNGLALAPARYDLVLVPAEASQAVEDVLAGDLVAVRCRREGSDAWEAVERAPAVTAAGAGRTAILVDDAPGGPPTVLSGEVDVDGVRVFERDVMIEPGTTFRMAPGASVLFRGRVLAEGEGERPVSFEPAADGRSPWGVVALVGPGAAGSRFRHCDLRGGSGWKEPLAEYSAMLSIHGVDDVVLEDCQFEDSRVVDDMVHGVYSDVVFRRCTFRRALFDALDMDISRVAVDACVFEESGNDAVDLMTTEATVLDTRFVDSGDKGVSVGEDSQVVVVNSLFDGCVRGLESKDRSRAIVLNCDFFGSTEMAVNAYDKNWRYEGGGTVYVFKSRFRGNALALAADRTSRITVGDCSMDAIPEVDARRITLEDSVDAGGGTEATDTRNATLEELLFAPGLVGRDVFLRADAQRRGSTLDRAP